MNFQIITYTYEFSLQQSITPSIYFTSDTEFSCPYVMTAEMPAFEFGQLLLHRNSRRIAVYDYCTLLSVFFDLIDKR